MAIIFSDTFTDTSLTPIENHIPDVDTPGNGWENRRATAVINLNQAQAYTLDVVNTVWVTNLDDSDVEIDVDVVVGGATTLGTNSAPGVAIRYAITGDTGYWAFLNRAAQELVLWKIVNGVFDSEVDVVSMPIVAGNLYSINVVTAANNITATVGAYSVSCSNCTDYATNTYFGFRTIENGSVPYSRFDNLVVDDSEIASSTISITSPMAYQTYQRGGLDKADISISGTYTGSPTAIEASFNGGAYATIDASPTGGSFAGTLSSQDAGQGSLVVRFTNDTGVSAIKNYVGIGEVFVVAGQSNAEGAGTNYQSYSHATLKASVYRQSGAWAELTDPSDSDMTNGTVWPLLATLVMANQGVPVAFITTADTTTGLVAPDADWSSGGGSFAESVSMVSGSGINSARAVLFYQGERDAKNGTSRSAYSTALSTMVDDLQTAYGLAGVKFVVAQIAQNISVGVTRTSLDAIRLAQSDAWDIDADILPGPITHDAQLSDEGGDGIHFKTDAELQLLADRWWRAIDYSLFDGVVGRGPIAAKTIKHNATTVRVEFTGGPLTGVTDSTGWLVTDSVGDKTIASTIAHGTDGVDIIVTTPFAGDIVVSWGSYNDAAGSTLKDTASTSFPPEPFVLSDVKERPQAVLLGI